MVSCTICFDEFIMERDFETAGTNLDIDIALRCDTKNCKAIVCNGCEVKLQNEFKLQNVFKYKPKGIIKCPLCRQQYFKNHLMWTVLEEELKNKIKEKKIYLKYEIESSKNFIEFNNNLIKKYQNKMDEAIETLKTYD